MALDTLRGIGSLKANGHDVVITLKEPNIDLPFLMMDSPLVIQPNGGTTRPRASARGPSVNELGVRYGGECFANSGSPIRWASPTGSRSSQSMRTRPASPRCRAARCTWGQSCRSRDRRSYHARAQPDGRAASGSAHYVFIMQCDKGAWRSSSQWTGNRWSTRSGAATARSAKTSRPMPSISCFPRTSSSVTADTPLFSFLRGRTVTPGKINIIFRSLADLLDIAIPPGGTPAHVHDLRHGLRFPPTSWSSYRPSWGTWISAPTMCGHCSPILTSSAANVRSGSQCCTVSSCMPGTRWCCRRPNASPPSEEAQADGDHLLSRARRGRATLRRTAARREAGHPRKGAANVPVQYWHARNGSHRTDRRSAGFDLLAVGEPARQGR